MRAAMQFDPIFIEANMVNATGIDSQWKSHFMQIFPIRMEFLPKTLPSDEAFFNKHWRGGPCDDGSPMTYRKFMAAYYPGYLDKSAKA